LILNRNGVSYWLTAAGQGFKVSAIREGKPYTPVDSDEIAQAMVQRIQELEDLSQRGVELEKQVRTLLASSEFFPDRIAQDPTGEDINFRGWAYNLGNVLGMAIRVVGTVAK